MFPRTKPIVLPPRYVVQDRFLPQPQPIIHPLVKVDRLNIFSVPKHIVRPIRKQVVVDHRFRPGRFY